MLPERLLLFRVSGQEALPRYLVESDHAWLRVLVGEFRRFEGRRFEALRERLREPLPCFAPRAKAGLAIAVLERLCGRGRPAAAIPPRRARSALFSAAQAWREHGRAGTARR